MPNYGQAPFYGTSTRVVLRMFLGPQWVARIASILTAAGFATVDAGKGRSVADTGLIEIYDVDQNPNTQITEFECARICRYERGRHDRRHNFPQ